MAMECSDFSEWVHPCGFFEPFSQGGGSSFPVFTVFPGAVGRAHRRRSGGGAGPGCRIANVPCFLAFSGDLGLASVA